MNSQISQVVMHHSVEVRPYRRAPFLERTGALIVSAVRFAGAVLRGMSLGDAHRSIVPPTYIEHYRGRWDSDRRVRQMQPFVIEQRRDAMRAANQP